MNLHTGTHIDAPFHMMASGWTSEKLPLHKFITPCRVLDLTGLEDGITREDLVGYNIQPGEFLLFKTRNSFDAGFRDDFIYIKADAAGYLKDQGIKGVGIDALGVERSQPGHETHLALLGNDIMVLEGLVLGEVPEGQYVLIALPLLIDNADGAPARAVLVEGTLPSA
ncbi:MAG: cyclase family protein, partial [Eubacteriales bacterium]|nr:cyclase family protein [Eubacteriales bacterium]